MTNTRLEKATQNVIQANEWWCVAKSNGQNHYFDSSKQIKKWLVVIINITSAIDFRKKAAIVIASANKSE